MPKVRAPKKKELDEDKREALNLIELLMSRRIGKVLYLSGEAWIIWTPVHLWHEEERACFPVVAWLSEKHLDKIHEFTDLLEQIEPLEEEVMEWEEFKKMKGLEGVPGAAVVAKLMNAKRFTKRNDTGSKLGEMTKDSAPKGDSTWWSMQDLFPSESSANDEKSCPF